MGDREKEKAPKGVTFEAFGLVKRVFQITEESRLGRRLDSTQESPRHRNIPGNPTDVEVSNDYQRT